MIIYWIALFLSCILAFFIIYNRERKKMNENITHTKVFLSFLPLFFVELFRWNVGVDVVYGTGYYYFAYNAVNNNMGNIYNYEPGFYLLMKICNLFHLNLYLFYCVITVIFYYLFTKFIANNSKNIIQSIILFVLSDLYLFSFSTLRQSLGIAFALYPLSLILTDDKFYKKLRWWIPFIISITMHGTIIYLFAAVIISLKKISKKNLIFLTIFICAISPLLQKLVSSLVLKFSYFEKYLGSNMDVASFSITYFSISLIIFLIAILNYKKLVEENDKNYILINICAVTTILMMNSEILIMPYRIFPLFVPVYIVLCSKIISSIKKNTYKRLFTSFCLIIPFLLLFINQYYIYDGSDNFIYKSIFDYLGQVWSR